MWRRGDCRSVGGNSRSGRGPRKATDRLAVGISGDSGKRVLAIGCRLCVCVSTCVTCVECWLEGEAVTCEAWGMWSTGFVPLSL